MDNGWSGALNAWPGKNRQRLLKIRIEKKKRTILES